MNDSKCGISMCVFIFAFIHYKHCCICVGIFLQAKPRLQREGSCASLHNSLMRNSIFQLMIHTLDPLSDEGMGKQKEMHKTHSHTHTRTHARATQSLKQDVMLKSCEITMKHRGCSVDMNHMNITSLHMNKTFSCHGL